MLEGEKGVLIIEKKGSEGKICPKVPKLIFSLRS